MKKLINFIMILIIFLYHCFINCVLSNQELLLLPTMRYETCSNKDPKIFDLLAQNNIKNVEGDITLCKEFWNERMPSLYNQLILKLNPSYYAWARLDSMLLPGANDYYIIHHMNALEDWGAKFIYEYDGMQQTENKKKRAALSLMYIGGIGGALRKLIKLHGKRAERKKISKKMVLPLFGFSIFKALLAYKLGTMNYRRITNKYLNDLESRNILEELKCNRAIDLE